MAIEVPTPSTDLISQVQTATIETTLAEVSAITALRQTFTQYAKHNGFIYIGNSTTKDNVGRVTRDVDYYHGKAGQVVVGKGANRMHGILMIDTFDSSGSDSGRVFGYRLWLTEDGVWLELKRDGRWSNWQGAGEHWACGQGIIGQEDPAYCEPYGDQTGGHIRVMTDTEVADEYNLADLLERLGKSMDKMCKTLPDRFSRLKARTELAQRVIAATAEL